MPSSQANSSAATMGDIAAGTIAGASRVAATVAQANGRRSAERDMPTG